MSNARNLGNITTGGATGATTASVTTSINNLIDAAPGALNTLNELAAALGDDANFSTTVTNSIATKLPLAGGTLTGDVTFTGDSYNIVWDKSANSLKVGEDAELRFGSGDELRIFHDGTNNIIRGTTSPTYIQTDNTIHLTKNNASENMAKFIGDGAVELYHNNAKKVETTSSGVTVTGSVGIGTDSPGTPLHVYTASGNAYHKLEANANGTRSANLYWAKKSDGSTLRGYVGTTGDASKMEIATSTNDDIHFYTNNDPTDKGIMLKANGNVGIGTTTPGSRRLKIVGSSSAYPLSLDSTNTDYQLEFTKNGTSEWWIAASASSFKIHENGVGDKLTVLAGGKVGVGTNNPTKLLHLYGDENVGGLGLVIQDDGWGAPNGMFMITTRNSDGAFTIRKNTSNAFDFATSTDMLSVRGDGKVGIGTTTPGEKLEVDGVIQIKTAASTHPAMRFMEASDTRGYLGSGDWAINGLADADFGISSGASGKLALGTSAGTARLTLNTDGTILAGYMAGLNHTIPPSHGDGYVIYRQIARFTQNCSATNLDMEGTKWVAHKSGSATFTALMFITSGSYYFNFKVKNLSNGTYIFNAADGGGYNSYKLQGGNVHAEDAYYRWNVSGFRAGDQYVVEMSASSGNGQTLYTNTSQSVSLSDFEVTTHDAQIDQSMTSRVKSPYFTSPSPGSSSANGTAVYNAHTMYRNAYAGSHRILLGHFGFRAYAQFMDFRTNLNSNSYMFMFEAHGYFYGAGQMMCSRGGYMYTGNAVINQQDSIPSTNTSCRIYNYYRDSSGFLCGKISKNHSGYTEGQLYLYWARFGGNDTGLRITAYSQNNTTSNIF